MSDIQKFYKTVLSQKGFYIPVLFFAIVAYSFSIYNRTVGWDDLLKDFYIGSGHAMLSNGRWGMVVWAYIMGITSFDPFIDRFIALVLIIAAGILLSYILYTIDKSRNIFAYSILVSTFITFPLINEIWEYTGANFNVAAGLCLVSMACLVLRSKWTILKKIIVAALLLVLPISSYESTIFYYVTLVCIIIFYRNVLDLSRYSFRLWIYDLVFFFIPVLIAFAVRLFVTYVIRGVMGIDYIYAGATNIYWFTSNFGDTLKATIFSNVFYYVLNALVYLPITIFSIAFALFFIYLIVKKQMKLVLLGVAVIVSVFLLAIVQGGAMPYRTAQTVTIFVSFVVYLFVTHNYSRAKVKLFVYILAIGLCWYQAVFLNRILCLNNLRSDNEVSVIHQIGTRLTSEFEKKPVVFVSPYKISRWISRQITVDESTWNGRLFCKLCEGTSIIMPYKFVGTNINCATEEYHQIQELFSYYGYDINVIMNPFTNRQEHEKAVKIAERLELKPYQIYDVGDYLIVNLGGVSFLNSY